MYQDRKKTTRSLLYYWWQFRSSCCWSSERRKWTFDLVGIDLNLAVYVSTSWGWGSSKTKGLEARYTLWYFVDRVSFFSLKRTCSGCSIFRCFFFPGDTYLLPHKSTGEISQRSDRAAAVHRCASVENLVKGLKLGGSAVTFVGNSARKMNGWNLKITSLKRKIIFQTSIIVFHVDFPGCRCLTKTTLLSPRVHISISQRPGTNLSQWCSELPVGSGISDRFLEGIPKAKFLWEW